MEYNKELKDYLCSGPKNARYIHSGIQNQIIEIISDSIRDFIKKSLSHCGHFSIMADEVTSHNSEILAVCLRFLEYNDEHSKPTKHKMLLDFVPLDRITGAAIAKEIKTTLEK